MTIRALVLTNHLANFAGSEIVAIEVFEELSALGCNVTLRTNYLDVPLSNELAQYGTSTEQDFDLSDFDIVWSQHGLASAYLNQLERSDKAPIIVPVCLSPYEPMEWPDLSVAVRLNLPIYVNSEETAEQIAGVSADIELRNFRNAAPERFFDAKYKRMREGLKRIAIISNHVPDELRQAMELMRRRGTECEHFGIGGNTVRVTPELLCDFDAVVTIGKTVQYCIALGLPVYLYDHFGGEGWLTPKNIELTGAHNFSGRPQCRRLNNEEIVDELTTGFANAVSLFDDIESWIDVDKFRLRNYVNEVLARAKSAQVRANNLSTVRSAFSDEVFRYHVLASRKKNEIIRREFPRRKSLRVQQDSIAALKKALDAKEVELKEQVLLREQQLKERFEEIANLTLMLAEKDRAISRLLLGVLDGSAWHLMTSRRKVELVKRSGIFDAEWYLGHYKDVANKGVDPLLHYVLHGASEGRLPNEALAVMKMTKTRILRL